MTFQTIQNHGRFAVMFYIAQTRLERKSVERPGQSVNPPEIPTEFDPIRFPIIATHIFGIWPAPNNGAAALVVDPRFHCQIEKLHAKGPRLIAELVSEIAVEYDLEPVIRKKIERYLHIPDQALDLSHARQMPPLPIYAVGGGRR